MPNNSQSYKRKYKRPYVFTKETNNNNNNERIVSKMYWIKECFSLVAKTAKMK